MQPKSRYYFVLITGIIIGLIAGFIMGAFGTLTYFTLTYSSEQLGFFYGLGNLLIGAGVIGACVSSIISGFAFHFLTKSRFSRYAHLIAAIMFIVVVFIAVMGVSFVGS